MDKNILDQGKAVTGTVKRMKENIRNNHKIEEYNVVRDFTRIQRSGAI